MSGWRGWLMGSLTTVLMATGGASALAASPPASLVPGPASGAPFANTQRPLTITELDATRTAVGMTGDHATVVADATVTPYASSPDPSCDAGVSACPFGQLVDPATDDAINVDARASVATRLDEGVPIGGVLAFALDGSRLELLGSVSSTSAGSYLVPVDDAGMAAAGALPAGSLIAVDGWLEELGWGVPCPQAPDPNATQDLPFVRCPGGWITPDLFIPTHSDTNAALQPAGFGVPVQATAYGDFAPDPQPVKADFATPPRHAVYLLRRVADPTPAADPALGWQVIGRLDAIQ